VLITSVYAVVRPVIDPDYWMHVAVGGWVLGHARLPGHDLFTYTVRDHVWVAHEYLSQVLISLLQRSSGPLGTSLVLGVLTFTGLVLVLAAARPARHPYPIVGLGLFLAVLAGGPVWGPRPQMFTFFLACLELYWLRRLLEQGGGRRDGEGITPAGGGESPPKGGGRRESPPKQGSRAILWLPLVMILWSNLHGGWPVAFLFLGVAALAEAVGWWGDRAPAHLIHLRRLALVCGLSLPAVLVNPNGPSVLLYPFVTLASSAQQNLIGEWQSPDFHLATMHAFEVMLVLLVAGLALGRPRLYDVLLSLAAIGLALQSVRHIVLFVAAATPVLIATWSEVWRRYGASRVPPPPAAPGTPPTDPPHEIWRFRGDSGVRGRVFGAVTLVVLILVGGVIGVRTAEGLAGQAALTRQMVPVGAADWLAAHPTAGTRMFNEYAWGGYLAARFSPDPNRRVFVFAEGALMGDDQLRRYQAVAALQPGWEQVLDASGVDYVVFDTGSALDDVLATEPGWRRVYRDSTATIYMRA
jgi:hypothetical protein